MIKTNSCAVKVFCILVVFSWIKIFAATVQNTEGNNKDCIMAAQQLGEILDADTVAVLMLNNKVLTAIDSENNTQATFDECQRILKTRFPNVKNFKIEINSQAAEKIIELSQYMETDLSEEAVRGRFKFLWNN